MSEEMFTIRSRRKDWEEEAARVHCPRYAPCPICFKCMVRAPHLYVKCQDCGVPMCHHTEKDRTAMIRRENFSPKLPLS